MKLDPQVKKYLSEQGKKGGKKHPRQHFKDMQKASVEARKRNKLNKQNLTKALSTSVTI